VFEDTEVRRRGEYAVKGNSSGSRGGDHGDRSADQRTLQQPRLQRLTRWKRTRKKPCEQLETLFNAYMPNWTHTRRIRLNTCGFYFGLFTPGPARRTSPSYLHLPLQMQEAVFTSPWRPRLRRVPVRNPGRRNGPRPPAIRSRYRRVHPAAQIRMDATPFPGTAGLRSQQYRSQGHHFRTESQSSRILHGLYARWCRASPHTDDKRFVSG
jgi:hypothetical protein